MATAVLESRTQIQADLKEKTERLEFLRDQEKYEGSLYEFVKAAWSSIDRSQFKDSWAIEAFCDHLECVSLGIVSRLLANYPPRCAKPIWEEEYVVERSRGRIKLKDVLTGDHVLNARGEFGRVMAVHEQGVLPLFKMVLNSGRSLRGAADHPVLTTRGYVNFDALKSGDHVGIVLPLQQHGDINAISADEARLIGYLIGDGSLNGRNQPGVTTISEAVSRDIEEIASRLGFFTRRRQTAGRNCWNVILKSHPKRWVASRDGEAPLRTWLVKHGLWEKSSYTKRVPEALFRASPEIIAEFLGAYWSCDGYISPRGTPGCRQDCVVGCDSVSKDLLLDIQHLLTRLGIVTRLRRKQAKLRTKKQGDIYISWSLALSRSDDVAKFSQRVRIVHEKAKRFETLEGTLKRTDFDRPLSPDEIVSVGPDGEGRCRCLTMDGSPTFAASDIAVHNTTIASICFPAWVWAQSKESFVRGPGVRFLCGSYSARLALDNSNKTRQLIMSPWYQKYWGDRFTIRDDQNTKTDFANDKGGSRVATSVGGSLLGLGGDIIIVDDPHNTETEKVIESDADRLKVASWWRELSGTRLNDPKLSAIVVVMQRLHQGDMSGIILKSVEEEEGEDWVHLCIPMEFDETRDYRTIVLPQYDSTEPWDDPRIEPGELMWEERFGPREIARMKSRMGPYMASGRLQQSPVPKGGGIIKRDWWKLWNQTEAQRYGLEWEGGRKEFPPLELVVGSLDTSYGEKQENDYNALTIWGVWLDQNRNRRAMLMFGWAKRVELHGKVISAFPNEAKVNFQTRQKEEWGLVEWVADTCKRYRVRRLLIEDRTRGRDVANEINRLYAREGWGVELIEPVGDKTARTHSIVPLFTDGAVWAPETKWSDLILTQCETFPKADHDDLHDTVTQFLNWARENGIILRADEMTAALEDEMQPPKSNRTVAEHYGV